MYRRNIEQHIKTALKDTPVVFLNGARQTGKTTLVQKIVQDSPSATYLTFDDAAVLAAAIHDPAGFLQGLPGMAVIDEVQKAPALFPAIKASVDRNRKPGRFLLTGSANILLLPKISESLAGRMEIVSLWPLSQGELEGGQEDFISRLFKATPFRAGQIASRKNDIGQKVLCGGFPEAVGRKDAERRRAWFGSYLTSILQRDVRDLAHIEGLSEMPRLLSILAARIGGHLNMADISRAIGIPHSTLKRYLAILETTFLVRTIPSWSANLSTRLVKASKLYLCDSGLAAYLNGVNHLTYRDNSPQKGPLFENFVLAELLKQASWSKTPVTLSHFRTSTGREVDFVVEAADGRLAGMEVKAASTARSDDFDGLKELAHHLKSRFSQGVVLYAGDSIIPFGDRLWAVPVEDLWRTEE